MAFKAIRKYRLSLRTTRRPREVHKQKQASFEGRSEQWRARIWGREGTCRPGFLRTTRSISIASWGPVGGQAGGGGLLPHHFLFGPLTTPSPQPTWTSQLPLSQAWWRFLPLPTPGHTRALGPLRPLVLLWQVTIKSMQWVAVSLFLKNKTDQKISACTRMW